MPEMLGKWDRAKHRRIAMLDLLKTTNEENAQPEMETPAHEETGNSRSTE
jgi:hypothetical protein